MVCKTHADLLENLNNDNDNDNRYQHDREIIAVIAVVYGLSLIHIYFCLFIILYTRDRGTPQSVRAYKCCSV